MIYSLELSTFFGRLHPLIVHLHEKKQIHHFCSNIPEHAHTLIDTFWPGPLTLVLKKRQEVLDAVTEVHEKILPTIANQNHL